MRFNDENDDDKLFICWNKSFLGRTGLKSSLVNDAMLAGNKNTYF
jgi:hypothetical protein